MIWYVGPQVIERSWLGTWHIVSFGLLGRGTWFSYNLVNGVNSSAPVLAAIPLPLKSVHVKLNPKRGVCTHEVVTGWKEHDAAWSRRL